MEFEEGTPVLARIRAMLPKIGAGLAIAAVASVAGVISYGHIYQLTLALHQSLLTARLMPVAIDGLVTVGSVVLLQSGSRIGWLGVGPGLALSVFANVESGIRYGWLAAVWAGIPALSFFLATFIFEQWLKSQAKAKGTIPAPAIGTDTVAAVPTAPVTVLETVAHAVPVDVPDVEPVTVPASTVHPVPAIVPRTVASGRAPVSRSKTPVRMFAAELESGQLPSLREVKRRAGCGTPRAQVILAELAAAMEAAAPKAAL